MTSSPKSHLQSSSQTAANIHVRASSIWVRRELHGLRIAVCDVITNHPYNASTMSTMLTPASFASLSVSARKQNISKNHFIGVPMEITMLLMLHVVFFNFAVIYQNIPYNIQNIPFIPFSNLFIFQRHKCLKSVKIVFAHV